MQRSVRPKSAKGKPRPTPPQYPKGQETSRPRQSHNRQVDPQEATPSRPRPLGGRTGRPAGQNFRKSVATGGPVKTEAGRHSGQGGEPSLPPVSRPTSSLSKYSVLPRIPSSPEHKNGVPSHRAQSPAESEIELDLMSSFAQQMILDSTQQYNHMQPDVPKKRRSPRVSRTDNQDGTKQRREAYNQEGPANKKTRTQRVPDEQKLAAEPQIKLALKLPDGKRLERLFSTSDKLSDVADFAQTKMRTSVRRCNIYSMLQVPKVLLRNWRKSLSAHGIVDRTVLYIEEKD